MQLTNGLIKMLRPHVTGFSEFYLANGEHSQQVTIGGVVNSVLDTAMLDYSEDDHKLGYQLNEETPAELYEGNDYIYLMVDDAVGEMSYIVPGVVWRQAHLNMGDVVLATGVLYQMKKVTNFISKAGTPILIDREDEPLRLLVKDIRKLPEQEGV